MPKIKEVYEYSNGSWANGTPIGADASNVDVALSDSTSTKDLQLVLGNVSVSDPSMKTQLTGKVSVLDPASETDTSEDINGTDVVVAAGESQTTMWSKFNMFRKRVSNKFSNFLISSVEDVVTPSDTKTYSQAALNSYFADVIGYKTDADVATVGSVADQLSTLNNKTVKDDTITVTYQGSGQSSYVMLYLYNGMVFFWGYNMNIPFNTVFYTIPEKYRPEYRLLIATAYPLTPANYVNVWSDGRCLAISANSQALEQVYWFTCYPQKDLM